MLQIPHIDILNWVKWVGRFCWFLHRSTRAVFFPRQRGGTWKLSFHARGVRGNFFPRRRGCGIRAIPYWNKQLYASNALGPIKTYHTAIDAFCIRCFFEVRGGLEDLEKHNSTFIVSASGVKHKCVSQILQYSVFVY